MKKLLTLLLAVFMISAVIFITACEDKHTELPAITISSTSKELPPKTTTKENVETTSPVLKEPIESSNVKKTVYYRDDGTISSEYEYNENGFRTFERRYKAGVLDYVLEYPGKDYAEHYIKKTEYSPDGSIRNIYYS